MSLYKYKAFDINSLKIIINDELSLSAPTALNDPMDCAVFIDGNRREIDATVCSLTERNNDYLMWSYYADGHKGICLKLNENNLNNAIRKENQKVPSRPKFHLKKVKYVSEISFQKVINKMMSKLGDIIIDKKLSLLTIKTKPFKHEKEVRLITKSIDIETRLKVDKLVDAVYIGLNMPADKIELITNIINRINMTSKKNITMYKADKLDKKNMVQFIKIN